MVARFFSFLLLLSLSVSAYAENVRVTDIKVKSVSNDEAKLEVVFDGKLKSTPDLSFGKKMIQIAIPEATIWPKIDKKVSLLNNQDLDTTLMGYQYTKTLSRVRMLLPFEIEGNEKDVEMMIGTNSIELRFPKKLGSNVVSRPTRPARQNVTTNEVDANVTAYDEAYLDKLLKEKELKPEAAKAKVEEAGWNDDKRDVVKSQLAATSKLAKKNNENTSSILGYVGKFAGFLGLVIVLFYFIVTALKKGVMSRGKLGFLNNSKLVTVLNTTYIAPKRALITVKIHNQIFVIGSSENGMNLISELGDTVGLLKEGEKIVAGNNFDTKFETVSTDDDLSNIKLKSDEDMKRDEVTLSEVAKKPAKKEKKSRFSDQIKKRLEDLKPLNSIH